jgi:hypothetical protein
MFFILFDCPFAAGLCPFEPGMGGKFFIGSSSKNLSEGFLSVGALRAAEAGAL